MITLKEISKDKLEQGKAYLCETQCYFHKWQTLEWSNGFFLSAHDGPSSVIKLYLVDKIFEIQETD